MARKINGKKLDELMDSTDIGEDTKRKLREANKSDERPKETRRPQGGGAATPPREDVPEL